MEDEEMMNVDSLFCEWFRKQNIEDVGIKELAGNAYFEGYEKAKEDIDVFTSDNDFEKFVKLEDYQKLRGQIEKMKCCGNCIKRNGCARRNPYLEWKKCDQWEDGHDR